MFIRRFVVRILNAFNHVTAVWNSLSYFTPFKAPAGIPTGTPNLLSCCLAGVETFFPLLFWLSQTFRYLEPKIVFLTSVRTVIAY